MGAAWSSAAWLAYGSARDPAKFWASWLRVNVELVALQVRLACGSLGMGPLRWLRFQWETHALVWGIEVNRRMEEALARCTGASEGLDTALPHVDTSFAARPLWHGLGALFARRTGPLAMAGPGPVAKDIVLIGGGHSHAFVIKNMGMKPEPGVRVTLITNGVETPYSGMLPGHVAGIYSREECHIDLVRLCNFGKARLVVGQVVGVDRHRREVQLAGGRPPVAFDVLSIDIGSSPRLVADVDSAERAPTPVKPISEFSARWDALVDSIAHAKQPEITLAVVGAGAGGVELTLSMQERLRGILAAPGAPRLKMVLVCSRDRVCPSHSSGVQRLFLDLLCARGVEVVFNFRAEALRGGCLVATDGRSLAVDECVWCTSARTQDWLRESGLATDEDGGFMRVQDTLESENAANVFGAGDCANVVPHPRPKAGVFAVRQGPPLAENLRRAARNLLRAPGQRPEPLLPFHPQTSFLGIIGTGRPHAIASRGEMAFGAEWLWHLKDWIDRKWMAGYSSQLPLMGLEDDAGAAAAAAAGEDALAQLSRASSMRCGGCGAKVGKSVLDRVVERMQPPTRPEVELGLDAPDDGAVVRFDPQSEQRVVQTVDFFRSFLDDPYVFGQIAANHALSDCHAMCAQPVTAMAIAVVPFAAESIVERDLAQMMAGVNDVLRESECALVGGHSCEGAELALGLSVSGTLAEGETPLTKGGMQAGDVLVLTKPIGTGVLFAANMRNLAKGVWVSDALSSMRLSNRRAALLARDHGAHACTDVTGFGLLGHLVEMVMASAPDLQAALALAAVPTLPGARDCVRAGVFSSLQPQNRRLRHAVEPASEALTSDPSYPLFFDPQTSGGLLVALPVAAVEPYLRAVRAAGCEAAALVGEVRGCAGGEGAAKVVVE